MRKKILVLGLSIALCFMPVTSSIVQAAPVANTVSTFNADDTYTYKDIQKCYYANLVFSHANLIYEVMNAFTPEFGKTANETDFMDYLNASDTEVQTCIAIESDIHNNNLDDIYPVMGYLEEIAKIYNEYGSCLSDYRLNKITLSEAFDKYQTYKQNIHELRMKISDENHSMYMGMLYK